MFIIDLVVQHEQQNILAKYYFDTMSRFKTKTSFYSISIILLFQKFFEQLNLIFTKYLGVVKLFNVIRGTICQNKILYHVLF